MASQPYNKGDIAMSNATAATPLGERYNPNYDPSLRFRPVPIGTYTCNVKMADPDLTTRWTKKTDAEGRDYYYGKPVVEIVDGDFAGRKVYGFLSTMLNDQGGTSAHDVIIAAGLSHQLAEVETHEDLTALVDEALAEGAKMNVYIDWTASFRGLDGKFDYKDAIRGKNLPKDDDGNTLHAFDKKDEEGEVIGQYIAQAEARYYRAA
jgi:hypothetical protein